MMQNLTCIFLIFVCLHNFNLVQTSLEVQVVETQGSKITGATSGATGFVHSAVNNLVQLITVSGNFSVGENLISSSQTVSNIQINSLKGVQMVTVTVAFITTRNFDDVKSVFMNSPNSGQDFTANLVLSSNLTLGGTVTVSNSGSGSPTCKHSSNWF